MSYDYKKGKLVIEEILNGKPEINDTTKIPKSDNEFTFDNAHYGWVTAIFVDIRDSTALFSGSDKYITAKIVRAFTSEIIEILREDSSCAGLLREIGIRGDCVYAIYTAKDPISKIVDIYLQKAFYINTFLSMLNKMLDEKGYRNIKAGIGVATDKELVIKAGRRDVGINAKVWIGNAVTKASHLSSLGNKDGKETIALCITTYKNAIEHMISRNLNHETRYGIINWFSYSSDDKCYFTDVVKKEFNNWVKNYL